MKIGIYAGSLRPGGGLTALKQLLEGLCAIEGCEVVVFTGARDTSKALEPYFQSGGQVREERFLPDASSMRRHLASKWAFRGKRAKLDLLITVNYHLPAACPVAVYHLNLLSFMAGPQDSWAARWKRWDARRACRRADHNWFESQFLFDQAAQAVGAKAKQGALLYLGVHSDFFASEHDESQRGLADLLLVSSMQAHKDNPVAIEALAKLRATRPEVAWRLRIAGGQSRAQWAPLEEQCRALGVHDAVEFMGPLPKQELSRQMQSSLCLINPSRIESFCMVALEAMASYCPSIVTASTSMPESVGEAARVVPAGDVDGFVAAILDLHDNAEQRSELVRFGRERAESFSAQTFREQLRRLILA